MKKLMTMGAWVFIIINGLVAQNEAPPPEVLQVANDHFVAYLTSSVSEDTKTIVGFDASDNLSMALLGAPFRLYTLPADAITHYKAESTLRSMLQETDMWYFPITIGGTVKMMLYVGKRNGIWERAGLGSAGLAREMQNLVVQYSPTKGYTPILVQQRNTGSYLFSIPQINAYNLTEAYSGSAAANPRRYTTLKKLSTTILELQKRKEIQPYPLR
jgi:hypothetical protein